jgi:6-pyruvoyltetrahydropterin/6-carboxytetrahydropterin synthase
MVKQKKMKTITKRFELNTSHRLIDNNLSEEENKKVFGKCFNYPSHGHNMILDVTITGIEKNGMIMNFTEIKEIVNKNIYDVFDHHFINDLECMKDKITTAENIIEVMWKILDKEFSKRGKQLIKLKLHETPNSWCELNNEEDLIHE